MRFNFASFVVCAGLAFPHNAAAQQVDPNQTPQAVTPERPVSWKRLIPNILSDQKRIWSYPVQVGEGQHLVSTAAVLGTTAALIALDPVEAPYFRGTAAFRGFNTVLTSNATIAGILVAPASFYVAGLIRKDSKLQHTGLFAGEALADAEVVVTALKYATRRERPYNVPLHGNYSDSWFEGGSLLSGGGSFPSGHTIAAFSIATVVARRYGNHRWVPYVSYGLAALVGFSRLSLSAHFLSDVFVGGALGYSISRFAVLPQ